MAEKLIVEDGTWFLVTEDASGNIRKVPGTFKASPEKEVKDDQEPRKPTDERD